MTLILLILTVSGLIALYTHGHMSDLMPQGSRAMMNNLEKFISGHPKLILTIAISRSGFLLLFAIFDRNGIYHC